MLNIKREIVASIFPKSFIFLSLFLIIAGCEKNEPNDNSSNVNINSSQTSAENPITPPPPSNEKLKPAYNGETKEVGKGLPVPVNSGTVATNINQTVEVIDSNPGDSIYSVEMNDRGQPVETRIFRNDIILAKVQKTTINSREYLFKVFLKNGKVIESESEKLKDLRLLSTNAILDAINMKIPANPENRAMRRGTDAKKKDKGNNPNP